MPAKKKTEDTSETTAIKTPRKRATKKAIEAELEIVTNNDSVATNEVIEVVEIKEVNEVTNDKSVEVANMPASANLETTPLANLDTVETTTDNNQTDATDSASEDLEGSEKKKKKKKGKHNDGRMGKQDIDVQKEFYDRVINEELEVTIQLSKLSMTGIITYEDQYSILIKTKFGEQFLYKQGISFISFKKPFRRPFIRRDRPFFNNRENTDNQSINDNDQVRQDSSTNQPTFDKAQTQRPNINKPETSQQTSQQPTQQSSEQPMRRSNEPRPPNRYQNQPPKNQPAKNQPAKNQPAKNQPAKNQPQKDAREVKVYKIVCAPPVKPKK